MKLPFKLRATLTIAVTFLVWGHVAWDYFHGGIPVHYVLQDPNMPGIPNWLGGIVLPFFTWFLLYRIHKRIDRRKITVASESLRAVVLRFLAAVLIAILIAICFMNGIDLIDYIMGCIFILAFFFPLYKSEYLLGWVLGSAFTFGAIIPIGFGSLLALIFFMFYQLRKGIVGLFRRK
ncbi:hypothetical protein [Maribacter halichondriae]|uniref:hypothetical protein n=1 Tax=Maribacter halichondriae TaxID=2980554 RepID=UPI0023593231|nr:hypothetical protein [Maribacter sp. Hal144]